MSTLNQDDFNDSSYVKYRQAVKPEQGNIQMDIHAHVYSKNLSLLQSSKKH